jgi:hypothetical protein
MCEKCQAKKYRRSRKEIPPMVEYDPPSDEVIFVKWFRHWRTGKRVYPKNGEVIAIRIKKKKKPEIV